MTNHPLSRRSLHYHQPVFPKIVMLVSTIYLRLSKETRHKHPRLRARLIQLCFGMLKPGIMSSIWYLPPSSKGTQWGECRCSHCAPMTKVVERCPAVFLLLACCAHHYSRLVRLSFRREIHQSKSSNGLLYEFYVWDQSTLPIQNHQYRIYVDIYKSHLRKLKIN